MLMKKYSNLAIIIAQIINQKKSKSDLSKIGFFSNFAKYLKYYLNTYSQKVIRS